MSVTIGFELRVSKINNLFGSIHLRITKHRKNSYKSLKLKPIPTQYWDRTKQRVKICKLIDYKSYNDKIEEVEQYYKNVEQYKDNDFITFLNDQLIEENYPNQRPTLTKYITIQHKFIGYLNKEHINKLPFNELSYELIEGFKNYLIRHRIKGKKMTNNTIINYLKVLSSFIRLSMKKHPNLKINNPFDHFTYPKFEKREKKKLSIDEVNKLRDKKLSSKEDEYYKNLFLFQIFFNGMRVSDLMTLRYTNIHNGNLRYIMMKNNREVVITLTSIHYELLYLLLKEDLSLSIDDDISKTKISENNHLTQRLKELNRSEKENDRYKVNIIRLGISSTHTLYGRIPMVVKQLIYFGRDHNVGERVFSICSGLLKEMTLNELELERKNLNRFFENEGKIYYHHNLGSSELNPHIEIIDIFSEYHIIIRKSIDVIEDYIKELKERPIKEVVEKINLCSSDKKRRKNFLFKILKSDKFKNIKEDQPFRNLNKEQLHLVHIGRILFNKKIKKIIGGILQRDDISSHISRYTFTNLLLKIDGITSKDISSLLSHSSIQITDKYISSDLNTDRDKELQNKVEGLFGRSKGFSSYEDERKTKKR